MKTLKISKHSDVKGNQNQNFSTKEMKKNNNAWVTLKQYEIDE